MFGSAFLGAHLMRGAAAAAALAWAIVHQTVYPWLSLGAGVAALVALRGCPMCWTVGLVETLSQGRRDLTAECAEAAIFRKFDLCDATRARGSTSHHSALGCRVTL